MARPSVISWACLKMKVFHELRVGGTGNAIRYVKIDIISSPSDRLLIRNVFSISPCGCWIRWAFFLLQGKDIRRNLRKKGQSNSIQHLPCDSTRFKRGLSSWPVFLDCILQNKMKPITKMSKNKICLHAKVTWWHLRVDPPFWPRGVTAVCQHGCSFYHYHTSLPLFQPHHKLHETKSA